MAEAPSPNNNYEISLPERALGACLCCDRAVAAGVDARGNDNESTHALALPEHGLNTA